MWPVRQDPPSPLVKRGDRLIVSRRQAHSQREPKQGESPDNAWPQQLTMPVKRIDLSRRPRNYAIVTTIIAIVIIYGSLYPFDFSVPVGGPGPVRVLLDSWGNRPARGDFLANILLYMPLGLFGTLSFPQRVGFWRRLPVVVAGGALLSLTMELTQYYDVGRDTDLTDLYANTFGTLIAAPLAMLFSDRVSLPLLSEIMARPVPTLMIAAWAGYRFYPFVPTIDLHKYWHALRPVILDPIPAPYPLYRHASIWLTLFVLIEAIFGRRRSAMLAPLFAAFVLSARVLIISTILSAAEVVGALVAVCLWPLLLAVNQRLRSVLVFLLIGGYVVMERLEPFAFAPFARPFGWVPFNGFMNGAVEVDVLSFLEKCFLYGSLLFLLGRAGMRPVLAAILVAGTLFATSWAETYLPDRSAEITDALMTLLIAGGFALIGDERYRQTDRRPAPP
jgi:VanZ family protein